MFIKVTKGMSVKINKRPKNEVNLGAATDIGRPVVGDVFPWRLREEVGRTQQEAAGGSLC